MNVLQVLAASLLAGIVAGGVIAGSCALFARVRHLRAGALHTMWFAALLTVAAIPLAGVASALVRAQAVPVPAVASQPATAIKVISGGREQIVKTQNAEPVQSTAAQRPSIEALLPWTLAIAAAGALAGLGALALSLVRLRAIKRRSNPLDDALSRELPWLSETLQGRETYLRLSYEIETPIAIGFGRPVILIPTDLATENGLSGIESLVIHEHAHLSHYDDYTNLVQRLVERVFWFNPAVWYIGRQLSLAREMAADDAVLERGNDRKDYAQTLWRLAREMRMPTQPIVAPGAFFTRKQISQRIEAILSANRGQFTPLDPTAIAAGLTLACFAYGLVVWLTPSYRFAIPASAQGEFPMSAFGQKETAGTPVTPVAPEPPVPPVPPEVSVSIAQRAAEAAQKAAEHASQIAAATAAMEARDHWGRHSSDLAMRCTSGCDLSGQDFSGADLHGISFSGADLDKAVFRNANLRRANFSGSSADGADFDGADLRDARFSGASIDKASFSGARMDGAQFSGIDLSNAQFDNATLRAILLSGCSGCDLSGMKLQGFDFSGIHLSGVDLSDTDLSGANLRGAQFSGVKLDDANLDNADLTDASFSGCSLSGASTKNAKMDRVNLSGSSF